MIPTSDSIAYIDYRRST